MDIWREQDVLDEFINDVVGNNVIEAMDMLINLAEFRDLAPTAEQWATHPWATHFMRDMDGWGLWCLGEPRFENGKWRFSRVFETEVENQMDIPLGIDPRILVWTRPTEN